MSVLKNARHEKFAQGIAKGMTQEAAYEAAGYKANRSHAARLVAKGNIQARVAELTEKAAEKTVATKAWIIEQLIKNAQACMKPGETYNASAANKALELLGKERGMFIDRRLLGVRRIEDMTEEELLEFLGGEPDEAELRAAAGTPPLGHA